MQVSINSASGEARDLCFFLTHIRNGGFPLIRLRVKPETPLKFVPSVDTYEKFSLIRLRVKPETHLSISLLWESPLNGGFPLIRLRVKPETNTAQENTKLRNAGQKFPLIRLRVKPETVAEAAKGFFDSESFH